MRRGGPGRSSTVRSKGFPGAEPKSTKGGILRALRAQRGSNHDHLDRVKGLGERHEALKSALHEFYYTAITPNVR